MICQQQNNKQTITVIAFGLAINMKANPTATGAHPGLHNRPQLDKYTNNTVLGPMICQQQKQQKNNYSNRIWSGN